MALFRRIRPGAGTAFAYVQSQTYRSSTSGVGYQIAIDEFFGVRTGSISGTAGADGASTGSVGVSGTVAGSAGATGAAAGVVSVAATISPGQTLGVRSMNSLGYVVLLSVVEYTVEIP